MESVVLGFFLGLIGSGFGFVLQQVVQDRARGRALRRALVAELRENLEALATKHRVTLARSAWDAARTLSLDVTQSAALSRAYTEIRRYNIQAELIGARAATAPTGVIARVFWIGSGPINYAPAKAAIESALASLGA